MCARLHSEHRRLAARHACHSKNALLFLNECKVLYERGEGLRPLCYALQSTPHPIRENGTRGKWPTTCVQKAAGPAAWHGIPESKWRSLELAVFTHLVISRFQGYRPYVVLLVQTGPMQLCIKYPYLEFLGNEPFNVCSAESPHCMEIQIPGLRFKSMKSQALTF